MTQVEVGKGVDLTQAKADLSELLAAYRKACDKVDKPETPNAFEEMSVIFERMLELGADIIDGGTEEDVDEFRDFVRGLDIPTDKAAELWLEMVRYGLHRAELAVLGDAKEQPAITFDATIFRTFFHASICVMHTLGQITDETPATKTQLHTYQQMVDSVATLPRSRIKEALAIARTCFAATETPETTGPSSLRSPGTRSFLKFQIFVRRRMAELQKTS